VARYDLNRFLRPQSIAVVGVSDKGISPGVADLLNKPDLDVFLVHPKAPTLSGRKAYPSLSAIGKPVDTVLSLVGAAHTIDVVSQARAAKAGGVVVIAAGFREVGESGQNLERDLLAATGDTVPLLGPNCFGFVDFGRDLGLWLAGVAPSNKRGGSIGLVSHTGGMLPAVVIAGNDRNIGLSYGISVGNEANVDMVDCMEFLIDDPATRIIALIVESIRRPDAFFEAAARAMDAGKPIVALKLGRSARTVALAKSHTGSLAGDAWVYEAALRQYGIACASDLPNFLDMLAGFEQLPSTRWPSSSRVAVITPTGGGASLASDVFDDFGLDLPAMDSIRSAVREVIPTADVLNPLDITGFAFFNPQIRERIAALYAGSNEIDTLLFQWHMQNEFIDLAKPLIDELMTQCTLHKKTFMFGAAEDGHIESGALALAERGAVLARGPAAAARALRAMTDFGQAKARLQRRERTPSFRALPAPAQNDIRASTAGPMLGFDATMKLLSAAGIPVAPYRVIAAGQTHIDLPEGDRFVVKLADIPHRTDIGALRFNVGPRDVLASVNELRELARAQDLPLAVAVQPQIHIDGEAFIGLKSDSGLGPMVVCGLGGIFVEVLKKVCGLIAPFGHADAIQALHQLDDTGVFEGLRGAAPWNREALASLLVSAGRLAVGGKSWISSLDINPIALSGDRFVALDGLCILQGDAVQAPAAQAFQK
jgi:acyl-CoA synthetase (NDP forming)